MRVLWLILSGIAITGLAPVLGARDAEARRAALVELHPVMVRHLEAGAFCEARALAAIAVEWEPTVPEHRYNLACVESRAGNPAAALAALRQAVDLGFADLATLDADPDLQPLRGSATFGALRDQVVRLQATPEPSPEPGPGPRHGLYRIFLVQLTSGVAHSLLDLRADGTYAILDPSGRESRGGGRYRFDAAASRVIWLDGINFEMGRGGTWSVEEDGRTHRIALGSRSYALLSLP